MKAVKEDIFEIKDNYDDIDWEKVISVLFAFAYSLLGHRRFSNRRKHLAYDFALKAITEYLGKKEKFDPSRNPDLIKYLKYNILRRLIYNFKESQDEKRRIILDPKKQLDDVISGASISSLITKDTYIEDHVDINSFIEKIEKKLSKKHDLKEVFDLMFHRGLKRVEVCEELNIPLKEYDNRSRRMKRLLDDEVKLHLKNQHERK